MRIDKDNIKIILILLILALGIGYSYLNTELNINGTANINSANWSVYWNNVQVKNGSVEATTPAIDTGKTTVTFNVTLTKPGDYYEFTVDAVNAGTLDAMIESINSKLNGTTITTLPAYLDYNVTYSDGMPLQPNQELLHDSTETYKIRIAYKDDISASDLPDTNQSLSLQVSVTYKQANGSAFPVPHSVSFAEDDWSTIVAAVKAGNTSNYNVGDTKEVDMGSLGTHTLRIANMSTPAECSTEGFSQTACGFVLEFADVITKQGMKTTTDTVHSWYETSSYEFVNEDVYNSLPKILKESIIDTKMVCSHGILDEDNFMFETKLFLISFTELYGRVGSSHDSAINQSRQFDYYFEKGVDDYNNHEYVAKKYNNEDSQWFLRTIPSATVNNVYIIYADGGTYSASMINESGISPAFRIG